jgi:hypothetical protein
MNLEDALLNGKELDETRQAAGFLQSALDTAAQKVFRETPNKSPTLLKYSLITCPEPCISPMSFTDFEYAGKRKQTHRERFLAEMDPVVLWGGLLAWVDPYHPKAGGGCAPHPLETIQRLDLLQNWFSLSDPSMEEALYEITPMRQFAHLTLSAPIPENTTLMNFRHLLAKHKLAPVQDDWKFHCCFLQTWLAATKGSPQPRSLADAYGPVGRHRLSNNGH